MATLQADSIADLIKVTQRDLGKMKWTDAASTLQNYVAFKNLMREKKVEFDSGYGIQWQVQVALGGLARSVGLYQADNINVPDVMQQATIPWRHWNTAYAIERREIAMNRDPARIVELVKIRRMTAMLDFAELYETDFWSKPVDSTDLLKAFGVPYWIVKNTSTGFNGGNPSGFSSGAGAISSSTYTGWANYTFQYTLVTKDDLIRKMRKAATFTNFMSPVDIPSYNTGNDYGFYTNYNVLGKLEEALEGQNQNLGNDVASKDGVTMFRQNPVTWVPKLETDTSDPIYGINWGVFAPVFLKGEYLREQGPDVSGNAHTVFQTNVDTSGNFKCSDRRRLFVGSLNAN